MSFEGQVAIVTGAGTGIGQGIARRLGAEGAAITVVDIDLNLGEQSVAGLADMGVDAHLVVGDVGEPGVADRCMAETADRWGRIDILVNNAAITGEIGTIWELPVEEMDRVYRTNLRSVFLFCRNVIPHMMERDYGRIVNIASIAGKEGNPNMVPYSATKAGVIAITKSVGKELARTGVRVNCVTPAVVRTRVVDESPPEQLKYLVDRIPMGRMGEIEEVAALVAWLASTECSFSTGAVFDLSGGRATY